jgi:cytochrome P450
MPEQLDSAAWIPFGGSTRRCVGAAFANLEMQVVLRTLLREFEFRPTDAPGERWHLRGLAYAPARGGRLTTHPSPSPPLPSPPATQGCFECIFHSEQP